MVKSNKFGTRKAVVDIKNINLKWLNASILNKLTGLCPPATLYLVISVLSFLGILFQNCDFSDKYAIGDMMIISPCHNAWFFVGKAIYIAIWTWLLNLLCSKGYTIVSWFLVLLPFIAMFMILGLIMIISMKSKEGIGDYSSIQRAWRGQIKSGITADDIYLVEEDKKKDKKVEADKLEKLIEERKQEQKNAQALAEKKAQEGFERRIM